MPDESAAMASGQSTSSRTRTAPSFEDHAPTIDPDTHKIAEVASTAVTTARRTPPPMRTTIDGPILQLPFQLRSGLFRLGSGHHSQAAHRPRDVAKQRELVRTSDEPNGQARGGFRVFTQVSGLGLIDLGDRRSRVQISAARPIKPQVEDCFFPLVVWRLEAHVTLRVTFSVAGVPKM